MRKLLTAVATATILLAGSAIWKAEAATPVGPVTLPPLTKSAPPVENIGCWCGPYRCACRRWGPRYRYYGWRRPYRWRY